MEDKVIDFMKALEESKLIQVNAHKNVKAVNSVKQIISMTEEEHDEFQRNTPSKSVLLFFSEYQDWKETNL